MEWTFIRKLWFAVREFRVPIMSPNLRNELCFRVVQPHAFSWANVHQVPDVR